MTPKFIQSGFAAAALVAAASLSAQAADLPPASAPVYTKAPAYMPAPSWTGWYIGVNVGGAWDANTAASFSGSPNTAVFFAANEFPTSLTPNPSGVIGGGQIGYNWQVSNWLFGLETDFQGSGYRGTANATPTPTGGFVPFNTSVEQHSDWFGTFRARMGILPSSNLLFYGTGGLAYGQTEASLTTVATGFSLATCPAFDTCTTGASQSIRTGWVAGGGVEYMFMPHWTARAEYLYINLGSQSVTALIPATAGGGSFTASAPFHENIVRGAINFKF
jgi:outer membrane immunogenic protein